jgi:SNF2 family DNA or RNA helicase
MDELRPYQQHAGRFLARNPRSLLAFPPGTGKTAIISSVMGSAEPRSLLVVCPAGPIVQQWQHELLRWGGIHSIDGTGSAKRRAQARQDSTSLIVNYEAMRQDAGELIKLSWDAIVFDESHRLKSRTAHVYKAAEQVVKWAGTDTRLHLVTGTPIINHVKELWTALHLMDPKHYHSFWRWAEARFEIRSPRYRGRVVREIGKPLPHVIPILREELYSRMLYRSLRELMPELPEVTETFHYVDLSAAERKAYDDMEDKLWMEVGDEIVQAANSAAKNTRLRQLASDWSAWGEPIGTKAQAAIDIAENLGEQAVIFCAFRNTAKAVALNLKGATSYTGDMDTAMRNQAVGYFKTGQIQHLVGTIATLAEGVDGLQCARNVIFIDRDWTPSRNDQAVGRLLRQGQRNAVNVIYVVANDTVDEAVNDALRQKRSVIDAVVHHREKKMSSVPLT